MIMKEEEVVLVDTQDNFLGTMPKMEAHQKGILHRAFSVFVLNSKNELLIQKRAKTKYHSPNLWTNTCCSHQRLNESSLSAGVRRLNEEMGLNINLKEAFTFRYEAPFDNGLKEHELDHVLIGYTNNNPTINIEEDSDWKWVKIDFISQDLYSNPDIYTIWFKIVFEQFVNHIKKNESNSK